MASRFFFLISALCICSVSADVFVSIDCGSSSDSYTDGNLIKWTGDDDYIENGESHVVARNNSVSHVMDTLRAFTTRNKNCYSIKATKGERVLLRASFYYGNYDNKSSPPTFDLQFDGNAWATIETLSTDYVYQEIIYVLKTDYVSVCVAQTKPDHIPFISAIEVRSLLPTMYDGLDRNYPQYLFGRVAYGANATIRYIDDPYDRIWVPAVMNEGALLSAVASDGVVIDARLRDMPPPAVLKNAIVAANSTTSITLSFGYLPDGVEVPVCFNMYFSEVTELDATELRSFHAVMDGVKVVNEAIIPPYGNSTELHATNFTVSSNSTLFLVPTNDSTLPPLLNAFEVFQVGDLLTDGTHAKDVEGLASLQNGFDEVEDWSGDPCLPAPYSWDWINCTSDPVPRVTALYLGSFGLKGALPDFSSMDALETIDFHNNSLEGPIPEFLAKLPNLKLLNLASNNFSGPVPDSLSNKNGLNLTVTNNPEVTKNNSSRSPTATATPTLNSPGPGSRSASSKKKNSNLAFILGTMITIPIFFII